MTKLKQYIKAICKVYWPLMLMFVCGDAFAFEVDSDAMDAAANKAVNYIRPEERSLSSVV